MQAQRITYWKSDGPMSDGFEHYILIKGYELTRYLELCSIIWTSQVRVDWHIKSDMMRQDNWMNSLYSGLRIELEERITRSELKSGSHSW